MDLKFAQDYLLIVSVLFVYNYPFHQFRSFTVQFRFFLPISISLTDAILLKYPTCDSIVDSDCD